MFVEVKWIVESYWIEEISLVILNLDLMMDFFFFLILWVILFIKFGFKCLWMILKIKFMFKMLIFLFIKWYLIGYNVLYGLKEEFFLFWIYIYSFWGKLFWLYRF